MTFLLIGMIVGNGGVHATASTSTRIAAEPKPRRLNFFRPPQLIAPIVIFLRPSGPSGPDFFCAGDLTARDSWGRVPSVRKPRMDPALDSTTTTSATSACPSFSWPASGRLPKSSPNQPRPGRCVPLAVLKARRRPSAGEG